MVYEAKPCPNPAYGRVREPTSSRGAQRNQPRNERYRSAKPAFQNPKHRGIFSPGGQPKKTFQVAAGHNATGENEPLSSILPRIRRRLVPFLLLGSEQIQPKEIIDHATERTTQGERQAQKQETALVPGTTGSKETPVQQEQGSPQGSQKAWQIRREGQGRPPQGSESHE